MWNRSDVANIRHLKANPINGAHSGFTSGTRPFDQDADAGSHHEADSQAGPEGVGGSQVGEDARCHAHGDEYHKGEDRPGKPDGCVDYVYYVADSQSDGGKPEAHEDVSRRQPGGGNRCRDRRYEIPGGYKGG